MTSIHSASEALAKTGLLGDEPGSSFHAAFEIIVDQLERQGYVVLAKGLPETVQNELLDRLQALSKHDFAPAAVGRGQEQQLIVQLRRDKIVWMETSDPGYQHWWTWVSALRDYLNRRLYLGLFSFESHFAEYQPGDFYQLHVDAFRGESIRVLSLVTYLNADWQSQWGGELNIYEPAANQLLCQVDPQLGTVVLFLSEEFPHEVLPAQHSRYSVAGWFRVNTSHTGRADPPQ